MEEEYEAYLDQRSVDPETKKAYKKAVLKAMKYFEEHGLEFETASVADFEAYIDHLMDAGENSEENILGVARYVYVRDMKEVWIYFAAILGGREILPSIEDRLEKIAGKDVAEEIFKVVKAPPLGSMPEKMEHVLKKLGVDLNLFGPEKSRRR